MRRFTKYPSNYVQASEDIDAAVNIEAERAISKYDSIRDLIGEDEWYYIEDYILNGDDNYSFDDILYTKKGWDAYCAWKMKEHGLKPSITTSTRIKAARYLRGC